MRIQLVRHLSPLSPLWFLLDTQTSLATQSCLITMRWITLPITATQSDFHDLVGAACSQLSRNYSPCTYRKPSSAAQPLAVVLMDWQTHIHEWTPTLAWRGKSAWVCSMCDTEAPTCVYDHLCEICALTTLQIRLISTLFTRRRWFYSIHAVLTLHHNALLTHQRTYSHNILSAMKHKPWYGHRTESTGIKVHAVYTVVWHWSFFPWKHIHALIMSHMCLNTQTHTHANGLYIL